MKKKEHSRVPEGREPGISESSHSQPLQIALLCLEMVLHQWLHLQHWRSQGQWCLVQSELWCFEPKIGHPKEIYGGPSLDFKISRAFMMKERQC